MTNFSANWTVRAAQAALKMRLLVMCVTGGLLIQREEFSEFPQREVTLNVLLLVHYAAAQSLLMGLPLQDLLLNGTGLLAHRQQ